MSTAFGGGPSVLAENVVNSLECLFKHNGRIPSRSVGMDVLSTTHREDIAQKAITDALRAGLLNVHQGSRLRRLITRSAL